MFVNNEISELINGLVKASKLIEINGIIALVTFHSIEDKICKNFFSVFQVMRVYQDTYLKKKR